MKKLSSINKLLIVGAGGHAKVVIDAVRASRNIINPESFFFIIDDNEKKNGKRIINIEISKILPEDINNSRFHIAIGDNNVRYEKFIEISKIAKSLTIIHPKSSISYYTTIGPGSFIAAQAVIGPDASIGAGCIINHGAVVDHDCEIGDFCHIAPNATLAGKVRLGKQVLIGSGANILPGISIGDGCVVGSGAVVLRDLTAGSIHAGVPAKIIEENK